MRKMDMTTTKTVVVFAIIFGCFAILYPKIFHPMLQHAFGVAPQKQKSDDVLNRVPPHLRKGPGPARVIREDITQHVREEHPHSFRAGPHPGLRAAAEMKKQAATTTGSGKGMMGVVLPMYAVGIVIYLIYTLTKVFGKKEEKKEDVLSNNPFSDIKYDANKKEFKYSDGLNDSEDEKETAKPKAHQRDLERLLLRADERNIRYQQLCDQILNQSAKAVEDEGNNDSRFSLLPPFRIYNHKNKAELEMRQLKKRLLETEAQMSRILKAMETVSTNVITNDGDDDGEVEQVPTRTVDSSPDMDSYEIVNADRPASRGSPDGTVEDVGPVEKQANTGMEKTKNIIEGTGKKGAGTEKEEMDGKSSAPEDDAEVEQKHTAENNSHKPPENVKEKGEDEKCEEDTSLRFEEDPRDEDCQGEAEIPAEPTEERISDKEGEESQELRPDLRKRNKGRRARKDD